MKKALSILTAALMLFSLCACGDAKADTAAESVTAPVTETSAETTEAAGYAVKYQVKINPAFTVCADENLCVTEVTAENEDAKAVLANVDVLGLGVNDAFNVLTQEAKAQGFMTQEKGNTVDITILEKDDAAMPTCHVCGGCGTVLCAECHGTGICCQCERCGGTGMIHFEAGPQCGTCGGSGVCPVCGGVGAIVVTNGEDGSVVYVSEGVPEMGDCPGCHGSGVCNNCHGGEYSQPEHDEECEGCGGTGVIHCNDDLNGYSWCPCCWGSGIDGTGDPNYAD